MGGKVIVSTCCLNQWALDFEGNFHRILQSIREAKKDGARYRSGPELEIPGFSCEDHFYESDTFLHSWEVLAELLIHPICRDIVVDVGMPVMHKNVTYNCRVVFFNAKIILIRPKLLLCDDFSYRETRWFTAWRKIRQVEDFLLPRMILEITGQKTVPFGDGVVTTLDTVIGYEICEELWNPVSSHIPMGLDGVEVVVNSSASCYKFRKPFYAMDVVINATAKSGGCYLFANFRGCDGNRLYFNGSSCISLNGSLIGRTKQFGLEDVELVTAVVDLDDVRAYRNLIRSRNTCASFQSPYPRVHVDFSLSDYDNFVLSSSEPIGLSCHSPEEEIALGPACWLWDYLRRSQQGGFFLPLNGGIGSCSTACIVSSMCYQVVKSIEKGNSQVLDDVQRIVGDPSYVPRNHRELCNLLLVTCYMGTENSPEDSQMNAKAVSQEVGSYHLSFNIDTAIFALLRIFTTATGLIPKFSVNGGTAQENSAIQNLLGRLRMVLSYLFAQLGLWVRGRNGGLLVLGSSNIDEALQGNYTKYGCSSADINPIGGISKTDLKLFLSYMVAEFGYKSLEFILDSFPTRRLKYMEEEELGSLKRNQLIPLKEDHLATMKAGQQLAPLADEQLALQTDKQLASTNPQLASLIDEQLSISDKVNAEISDKELLLFRQLRKPGCSGPFSMFTKLAGMWKNQLSFQQTAEKVKHFWRCYAVNRHKMTVITPAFHAHNYFPDDNRCDLRPFLYNIKFSWQFDRIDKMVQKLEKRENEGKTCSPKPNEAAIE